MTIRIPDGGLPPRPPTASVSRLAPPTATPATAPSTPVKLSADARHLQQVQQQLVQDDSVNSRRIAELQQAIDSGTYRVDSRQLAQNLVQFEGQF